MGVLARLFRVSAKTGGMPILHQIENAVSLKRHSPRIGIRGLSWEC